MLSNAIIEVFLAQKHLFDQKSRHKMIHIAISSDLEYKKF